VRTVIVPLSTKHRSVLFDSQRAAHGYARRKGIVNYNLIYGPRGNIKVIEIRGAENDLRPTLSQAR